VEYCRRRNGNKKLSFQFIRKPEIYIKRLLTFLLINPTEVNPKPAEENQ